MMEASTRYTGEDWFVQAAPFLHPRRDDPHGPKSLALRLTNDVRSFNVYMYNVISVAGLVEKLKIYGSPINVAEPVVCISLTNWLTSR